MARKTTYTHITCPRCHGAAFLTNQTRWHRIICPDCGLSHWFKLRQPGNNIPFVMLWQSDTMAHCKTKLHLEKSHDHKDPTQNT